jgi:hypothetical protein
VALGPGDRVPPFHVKAVDGHDVASDELWRDGVTVVLYYVFDWSGEDGG